MSQQGVKAAVARMIADDTFRDAVLTSPTPDAILRDAGFAITDDEMQGFRNLQPGDLQVAIGPGGPGTVASWNIDVRTATF